MDNNNPDNPDEENNIDIPQIIEEIAEYYRPSISFHCITDNPRTRTSRIVLQVPRVPFIVKRRLIEPDFPTTAVTCGVVPLSFCEDYEQFMLLLRNVSEFCRVDTLEGPPTRDNPVPGYDLWYEMMGPVRTRVPFYTHSWFTFKTRVRLVVLERSVEEVGS